MGPGRGRCRRQGCLDRARVGDLVVHTATKAPSARTAANPGTAERLALAQALHPEVERRCGRIGVAGRVGGADLEGVPATLVLPPGLDLRLERRGAALEASP